MSEANSLGALLVRRAAHIRSSCGVGPAVEMRYYRSYTVGREGTKYPAFVRLLTRGVWLDIIPHTQNRFGETFHEHPSGFYNLIG